MAIVYVAKSKSLQKWGAEVGLTKHLYKVGVGEKDADAAIEALNTGGHAGRNDWRLIKKQEMGDVEEEAVYGRLRRRVALVDPGYYPKIKGARGIFKINISSIEQQLLVQRALAGEIRPVSIKQADVADYLIRHAADETGGGSAEGSAVSRSR